uniref:Uncharacterized protein n=1 Tax=Meloidogyne enterolobii TaxID=390850 RepID=A0A6V7U2S9_MELEN|nr:unnamed protein product [Meloidogyne enterolobii]
MPCNSCIPPPPIFDIPPPPDPSLILHLLIEDIQQQQQHSFRPQQFYSCLKPAFPSFLSKLLFGDWLLPFLAIFLFCIFTIFVGLIILIRKRRKKREEEEEMRRRRTQNNGGEKKKKLNRKSNSFVVSSPASATPFQMPESDSSSPSNSSSSSSAFSSISNSKKHFTFQRSSTETLANSLTYSLNTQQQKIPKKPKLCWLTFSLAHPQQIKSNGDIPRYKLPSLPPPLPNNKNIPVPSFTKSPPKSVAFQSPKYFISRNISTPSCCYGSSEIYEELATDYQEDIAEPPYLKRLVNNRLPPPITRPPPLPPEQFNNNCCCCEKEGEKSGREEEIKQKINNFGNNKSENKFSIKTPPPPKNTLPKWMSTENEKQNKGMLSSPNIWTSTKENNEYICRQKRTYV